jgi:hypothetical protein
MCLVLELGILTIETNTDAAVRCVHENTGMRFEGLSAQ